MRVAIIGGYGSMGRWFAEFFLKHGDQVVISGRNYNKAMALRRKIGVEVAKTNAEAARSADLVIISVMPGRFEPVVKEIAPQLTGEQRVIDIASVKEEPVRIMHKHLKGITVLGTHPMFGPSAEPEGQNFVLTPTNPKEKRFAGEFGKFLKSNGFNVAVIGPKKHDDMVGFMLSLTHFVGFVTADTWKELNIGKFTGLSSTSFRFLKSFVDSIMGSSPELYSYLQMNVASASGAEEVFIKQARVWAGLAKRRKRDEIIRRMRKLNKYLKELDSYI
ncbi:MAG: prephenate dehydrogenase/arogenate dehydrogenase family protein [Candidatus Micrarchaeota archaeon]|nr:prephenate dehydrogenase/arogenate dehydrogenase family protein [Candidatus Micrarchaeota archaeon]MDE1834590.1 prephenate dehydrogenase/arogenate dehydrogenase family protein [Candidatus Micrarchaeota archaeon]MDE1859619.1 prephenate dehydrogenase/arogenate dehydrogenase family protein [Candidatus Micrarchaeota archaeon]